MICAVFSCRHLSVIRGSIYSEVDAKTQSLLMHDFWNLSHKPSQPCFHISPLLLIKPLISAFALHLLNTSPSKMFTFTFRLIITCHLAQANLFLCFLKHLFFRYKTMLVLKFRWSAFYVYDMAFVFFFFFFILTLTPENIVTVCISSVI